MSANAKQRVLIEENIPLANQIQHSHIQVQHKKIQVQRENFLNQRGFFQRLLTLEFDKSLQIRHFRSKS